MNKELFSYYLIFRKSTFCVLSIGDHKLLAVAVFWRAVAYIQERRMNVRRWSDKGQLQERMDDSESSHRN